MCGVVEDDTSMESRWPLGHVLEAADSEIEELSIDSLVDIHSLSRRDVEWIDCGDCRSLGDLLIMEPIRLPTKEKKPFWERPWWLPEPSRDESVPPLVWWRRE